MSGAKVPTLKQHTLTSIFPKAVPILTPMGWALPESGAAIVNAAMLEAQRRVDGRILHGELHGSSRAV